MAKRRKLPQDAKAKRTEEAIAKLRTYYELGSEALKRGEGRDSVYAKGVIKSLMEETGEHRATLIKCRQFANAYTPAEFAELCELRQPNGKPIGWGHVTKLLTIPADDQELRATLQARATADGWTARELEDQIKKHYEPVHDTRGRPVNLPTSVDDALTKIRQRTEQWLRWHEALANSDDAWLDQLPPDVEKQLKTVMKAIRKLQAEVDRSTNADD